MNISAKVLLPGTPLGQPVPVSASPTTAQVGSEQKWAGAGILPAAKAEHMTKNMPTAILFSEEGSRPCRLRTGSTSLSFSGMSSRMSTASNMVSQAAGNCGREAARGRSGTASAGELSPCVSTRSSLPGKSLF